MSTLRNQAEAGAFIYRIALENPRLNGNAIRVLAWMMTHAPTFKVRKKNLLTRLPIADGAWLTARQQLLNEGYLVHEKYQGKGGKWVHEYHVFRSPKGKKEDSDD